MAKPSKSRMDRGHVGERRYGKTKPFTEREIMLDRKLNHAGFVLLRHL